MNNKFKFVLPKTDKFIDLPIEIKWDFYGRDDSIDVYVEDVLEELVGVAQDFEVLRFAHAPYSSNTKTEIKYTFNFYSGNVNNVNTANISNWVPSYIPEGFSATEIYYYEKPFTKSFFKLDFYDSNDSLTQTNYFTIIIPVQQGATDSVSISPYKPNVNIKKPVFTLDYVGDKEGFFLYWLRKKEFLNINPNPTNTTETFYMTAKFFDARLGVFVKMMNDYQRSPNVSSPFTFSQERFFYYKVLLDYTNYTYQIIDVTTGSRVGVGTPIKWYEYVNP